MRLTVTNPSLWPAPMQDLHLLPDFELPGAPDTEAYTLTSSDRLLALLERCQADEWAMVLEHGEEVCVPIAEAWELEVLDESGRTVGHRMFLPTTDGAGTPGGVDPGVLTWAALGVLWQVSGRPPARG
jgi:hypothetical protein